MGFLEILVFIRSIPLYIIAIFQSLWNYFLQEMGIEEKTANKNYETVKEVLRNIGKEGLLVVFYSYYPKDPETLYNALKKNEIADVQIEIDEGRFTKEQRKKLFPAGKNETDVTVFDITLLFNLIRICKSHMIDPKGSFWLQLPLHTNISQEDDAVRINKLRIDINNVSPSLFKTSKAKTFWNDLEAPCKRLLKNSTKIDNCRPNFDLIRLKIIMRAVLPFLFRQASYLFKYLRSLIKLPQHIQNQQIRVCEKFYKRVDSRPLIEESIKESITSKKYGVVLTGPAGVGKTEMAISVRDYLSDYNFVWINAEEGKMKEDFLDHCKQVRADVSKDDSLKSLVYKFYEKLESKTIIVLDNVANPKAINDVKPDGKKPIILLVTTNYTEQWNYFTVHHIDTFTPNEAIDFAKQTLTNKKAIESEALEELVKTLEYLPLTLSIAVSYLNENMDETVESFLDDVKKNENLITDTPLSDYGHSTFSTWMTAKEKLQQDSVTLIQMISFMENKQIDKSLFKKIPDMANHFPNIDLKFLEIPKMLNGAVQELKRYSLITTEDDDKYIRIHSSKQRAVRFDLQTNDNTTPLVCQEIPEITVHLLKYATKRDEKANERKHYTYGKKWLSHILSVVHICEEDSRNETLSNTNYCHFKPILDIIISVDVYDCLCDALLSKGNYTKCAEVSTDLLKRESVEDNTRLLHYAAYSFLKSGKYKDARKLFEKLHEKLAVAGDKFEDICTDAQYWIGHCMMKNEEHRLAIKHLSDVLKKQEKMYTSTSEQCLRTRHDIAYSEFKLSEYQKAKEQFEEIYEAQLELIGDKHEDTLLTSHSLGHCLMELGELEQSEKRLDFTYKKKKEAFGDLHHQTLITYHTLGLVYMRMKQHGKATYVLEKVYKDKVAAMGKDNPSTLNTHHRVGNCEMEIGNYKKALEIFEEVYKKRCDAIGAKKERTLLVKADIACCYMKLERFEDALKIFDEIYCIQKEQFSKKKVDTFSTLRNMSICLKDRLLPDQDGKAPDKVGDYKKALMYAEEVLTLQVAHYENSEHAEIKKTKDLLGQLQHLLHQSETKKEK